MKRFEKLLTILTFVLLAFALFSTSGFGQSDYRDNYRNDYNQGRLLSTIKKLENRSDEFERRLRRDLDKAKKHDGSYSSKQWDEDYLLSLAREFRKATDRLEDVYTSDRNWRKSYNEAQRVLSLGQQIDSIIYNFSISKDVEKDWRRIKDDLNELANYYAYYRDNETRRNRGSRSYLDVVEKGKENKKGSTQDQDYYDFPGKRKEGKENKKEHIQDRNDYKFPGKRKGL